MTVLSRRATLAAVSAGAGLAACSPLAALNALGPRDRGARRVARGIAYGPDARQALDVFAPTSPGPWPVVVFFYGGGWDSGSRDLYAWAAQAISARGFVVALPDYRLVPDVHFPAFIEDAAAATARAAEVAGEFGGDPARLGVAGHSAGAHLAMMITLDRRYMAAVERPELIRAAAGLAGPYEFLPLSVPAAVNAFGRAPDPLQTQPVAFARPDAPPIWIGHGAPDTTVHVDDAYLLDQAMKAAGGRSELKIYPDLSHTEIVAALSPLFRGKAPVLADMTDFLRRTLA
ncbi:MAG: alpha/beta hydrolase [Brevundimonas sp.]